MFLFENLGGQLPKGYQWEFFEVSHRGFYSAMGTFVEVRQNYKELRFFTHTKKKIVLVSEKS